MKRLRIGLAAGLVIALTGSGGAYASGLITGANVRNGSLTGRDIKSHSLTTKLLSTGTVSSLRGRQGPAGSQGPAGPAGPSVVGQLTVVTSGNIRFAGTVALAIAHCPAGQRVVSGGGAAMSAGAMKLSAPTGDRSGWAVIGSDPHAGATGSYVRAEAVCAPTGQAVAASVPSHAATTRHYRALAAKIAAALRG